MGNFQIKIILITRNNIYYHLVYFKGHLTNYLVINGKYPNYHLLFCKG